VSKNKGKNGFMLLEAILSIVIISVCLTFMVQSLLTNFRAGFLFKETTRALMAMENNLGLVYATSASDDLLNTRPLANPYHQFTVLTRAETVSNHLKKIDLRLNSPEARTQRHLDVSTFIYFNET
jgi:type II secretory pathway pseudopilin PulG